uniref:Uncharacterized protein n=1 Tax=Tetranychus urticae TaxID=32264 RepID=T1KF82_TETUR
MNDFDEIFEDDDETDMDNDAAEEDDDELDDVRSFQGSTTEDADDDDDTDEPTEQVKKALGGKALRKGLRGSENPIQAASEIVYAEVPVHEIPLPPGPAPGSLSCEAIFEDDDETDVDNDAAAEDDDELDDVRSFQGSTTEEDDDPTEKVKKARVPLTAWFEKVTGKGYLGEKIDANRWSRVRWRECFVRPDNITDDTDLCEEGLGDDWQIMMTLRIRSSCSEFMTTATDVDGVLAEPGALGHICKVSSCDLDCAGTGVFTTGVDRPIGKPFGRMGG